MIRYAVVHQIITVYVQNVIFRHELVGVQAKCHRQLTKLTFISYKYRFNCYITFRFWRKKKALKP